MINILFNSMLGAAIVIVAIALPAFAIGVLINDLGAALIVAVVLLLAWKYIRWSERMAEKRAERQHQQDIQRNLKQLPPPPTRNALDD